MKKEFEPKINPHNIFSLKLMFEQVISYGCIVKNTIVDPVPDAANPPERFEVTISGDGEPLQISLDTGQLERLHLENFIFCIHRTLQWIGSMVATGQIDKPSSLRQFRNHWETPVRELRDFLMHLEEYEVKGKGRRKEKFTHSLGGVISADPSSTIVMRDCSLPGQFVSHVHMIGGRIDFISIFNDLLTCYYKATAEGAFEVPNSEDSKE